jgi:superfamily I DNA/RNA helicase
MENELQGLDDYKGVDVKTVHSLGMGILCAPLRGKSPSMNEQKKKVAAAYLFPESQELQDQLVWVAEAIQSTATDWNSQSDVIALIDKFDMYGLVKNRDEVLSQLATFMPSLLNPVAIDYDDMIWIPLVRRLKFPKSCTEYDWILVDEAQDLNPAQIKLFEQVFIA